MQEVEALITGSDYYFYILKYQWRLFWALYVKCIFYQYCIFYIEIIILENTYTSDIVDGTSNENMWSMSPLGCEGRWHPYQ